MRLFKATFRDISRNNRFLVWLPGMPPDLVFMCVQASMPGESFSSNANYDSRPGVNVIPWETPYDIVQNECSLTFMCDPTYRIKSYFDRWREEVFDPTSGFGYMEDYVKDVKIMQLTRQDIPSYTVTLTDAWPKTMADINFDASTQGAPSLFTVTLVYGGQRRTDTLGWILSKLGVPRSVEIGGKEIGIL